MKKEDITMHSDNELSLIVMNEESLYNIRRRISRNPRMLDELFIYTETQLETLLIDIEQDLMEME